MAHLCRLVTPPGGTVLDFCLGSGSTGKACMREGFHFIGIDSNHRYVEIARPRIEFERMKVQSEKKKAERQLCLFPTETEDTPGPTAAVLEQAA